MKKSVAVVMALLVGVVLPAWADEQKEINTVKSVFKSILPNETAEVVSPSALPGMYEVVFGAQVMYVSADGRYILQGDLIDLTARENLTETARGKQRQKLMDSVNTAEMIIYSPKGEKKNTVTVFTDIDCGYCRKLHQQMDDYLAKGIEIRYLAFPRAGVNSKSYNKAVTVWCSQDRQAALTEAKAGVTQKQITCDNPVEAHLKLGEQFGVSGTPTLVLDNGEVIPGYVPPERLSTIIQASM